MRTIAIAAILLATQLQAKADLLTYDVHAAFGFPLPSPLGPITGTVTFDSVTLAVTSDLHFGEFSWTSSPMLAPFFTQYTAVFTEDHGWSSIVFNLNAIGPVTSPATLWEGYPSTGGHFETSAMLEHGTDPNSVFADGRITFDLRGDLHGAPAPVIGVGILPLMLLLGGMYVVRRKRIPEY